MCKSSIKCNYCGKFQDFNCDSKPSDLCPKCGHPIQEILNKNKLNDNKI